MQRSPSSSASSASFSKRFSGNLSSEQELAVKNLANRLLQKQVFGQKKNAKMQSSDLKDGENDEDDPEEKQLKGDIIQENVDKLLYQLKEQQKITKSLTDLLRFGIEFVSTKKKNCVCLTFLSGLRNLSGLGLNIRTLDSWVLDLDQNKNPKSKQSGLTGNIDYRKNKNPKIENADKSKDGKVPNPRSESNPIAEIINLQHSPREPSNKLLNQIKQEVGRKAFPRGTNYI